MMVDSTKHEARSSKQEVRSNFRFETLEIWKDAVLLIKLIYQLTRKFPKEEMYGIITQLRRAIISVASNIAEGSGGRSSQEFCRYLDISIGSAIECVSLILVSKELGYCSEEDAYSLRDHLQILIRRINAFKRSL